MEYAAESRDTELVEELASWFLKKVFYQFYLKDSKARFHRDVTIATLHVSILVTI